MLKEQLPEAVETVEKLYEDGLELEAPAQIVHYIPIKSILEGGQPIFGVGEFPTRYEKDTEFMLEGINGLAIMIIATNSDHYTLNRMLRRYRRAVQLTIQRDREKPAFGEQSILKTKAGVWYTAFKNTEPGPLLGEADPESLGEPPTSYTSWAGLHVEFTRNEI